MNDPRIIGLHGYAQSGKDTIAEYLAPFGYQRLAFADRLREAVYALDPEVQFHDEYVRVADLVDKHGWDYAKVNCDEVRRLLQVMGTEVGRELIRDSVWVDIVLDQIEDCWDNPAAKFVITDVRFPNELAALRNTSFTLPGEVQLWKVARPGVGPVNAHISDAGLPNEAFDVLIHNTGTLEDLDVKIRAMMSTPVSV